MTNTILIDGNDVRGLTGGQVVDLIDGIFADSESRIDPQEIPRRDGGLTAPIVVKYYVLTIPLRVYGATQAERNANLMAMSSLLRGDRGQVTITRHLDRVGGGFDAHTAPGAYIRGLSLQAINPNTGRVNLQYYQLNGWWLDADGHTRHYT